jgi:hypothetical protein
MGEDVRKSFWTSIPGILTGIASVIGVIITLLTALHIGSTPSPPTPITSHSSISTTSSQSQIACGTQLPGVNLFGSWNWVGTNSGVTQSGLATFKNDCTYTNVAKSGFTGNDEGHFIIGNSPTTTIKLQSNLGKEHNYLINKIYENSFHLSDLDNKVNLDFIRIS